MFFELLFIVLHPLEMHCPLETAGTCHMALLNTWHVAGMNWEFATKVLYTLDYKAWYKKMNVNYMINIFVYGVHVEMTKFQMH